jgi:hypothetical protein
MCEVTMAITRKPVEENAPVEPVPDQAAFDAYLRKGGSAASPQTEGPKDVRFTLQLPGALCQQLDALRQRSPVKTSRHHWVLEAIAQRIQRERTEGAL